MNTYKAQIKFVTTDYVRNVEFRSSARTDSGVARALGRYVAENFGNPNFEVVGGLIRRPGTARNYSIGEWSNYGSRNVGREAVAYAKKILA